MSWPNSITVPDGMPGRSTVPAPANDNWRMPNFRGRPPAPANDNFQTRSRGFRLPGVRLPIPGLVIGVTALHLIYDWYASQPWVDYGPWTLLAQCGTATPDWFEYLAPYPSQTTINQFNNCLGNQAMSSVNIRPMGNQTPPLAFHRALWEVQHQSGTPATPGARYRLAKLYGRPAGSPNVAPKPMPGKAFALPRPAIEPFPGFFPPLLNPPAGPAPMVTPGRYDSPVQIMPEWSDAGYRIGPRPAQETYLRSRPPASGTRERKVRVKDYAIGRTIEWLVAQSTEALDMQRALFEALPWWRILALYNAARRLELRYHNGQIIQGRLHYVDLTPDQKAKAIYDYIDEIDVAKALENALKMQLTDMFWAEIGRRMGRYQIGPWDDHGIEPGRGEPDWQWYVPDTAPDTVHNHWTYETLVNRRLTAKEAQRIHTRFDQFRSQPYSERKYK